MKTNKWLVRLGVLIVILGIAALMFVIGRGHTVYFDNKTATYEDTEYTAFQKVEIYVNGERVAKLSKKDRGMATWIGQHFKMELEVTRNKGDEPERISVAIELPYSMDGILVNLPELVAGLPQDVWLSEFVIAAPAAEDDDALPTEDDMGLSDF
ncbi:MAG: hypothetical protein IJQ62_13045 [Clostridia bacterium]|nr:hypothetical protein [Clostridia bacterium]